MLKSNSVHSRIARFFFTRKRYALLVFLLFAVAAASAAVISTKHKAKTPPTTSAKTGKSGTTQAASVASNPEVEYVSREQLDPMLQHALRMMGDRLEKPGKEAVAIAGRLSRNTASGPV